MPGYGIPAWRVKLAASIHSYADALAFIGGDSAKVGTERKLAASMRVLRQYDDEQGRKRIAVILYSTPIIVYREDGMFSADNGGHNTITTSTRLNMVAPPGWFFSHARRRLVGNHGVPMRSGEWHPAREVGRAR